MHLSIQSIYPLSENESRISATAHGYDCIAVNKKVDSEKKCPDLKPL